MLIRYVGLDVHKDSIKIAVADEGKEPAHFYASIPGENNKLIKRLHFISKSGWSFSNLASMLRMNLIPTGTYLNGLMIPRGLRHWSRAQNNSL